MTEGESGRKGTFTAIASKKFMETRSRKVAATTDSILNCIREIGEASTYPVLIALGQIAAATGVAPSTVETRLRNLQKSGIITIELDRKSSGTTEILRKVWINE